MKFVTLKNGEKLYFNRTKIMGIINVTPDSFYEESRAKSVDDAVSMAIKMAKEGADIVEIGGESTRPGSEPVNPMEEIKRVVPVIERIKKLNSKIIISVDTYRAKTAEMSIEAGADIINDISGLTFDDRMPDVVARYGVPLVLMHIKGKPKDMQRNPEYSNVLAEVKQFLNERAEYAMSRGIKRDRIIIDPGIGFGKTYEHNIKLIKDIGEFTSMDYPVLLGVSRKSFIGKILGNLPSEDRLEGTMAISCYASLHNTDIVRVHDVLENKRALVLIEELKRNE